MQRTAITLAILNASAFLLYGADKAAALQGGNRIPEYILHLLAVLGGWPGALVAQQWLRHKSVKAGFLGVFWLTVFANLALLGAMLATR